MLDVQFSLVKVSPTLQADRVELLFYFLPSGSPRPVLLSLFYGDLLARCPVPFLLLFRLFSFVFVFPFTTWSFWEWGFYCARALSPQKGLYTLRFFLPWICSIFVLSSFLLSADRFVLPTIAPGPLTGRYLCFWGPLFFYLSDLLVYLFRVVGGIFSFTTALVPHSFTWSLLDVIQALLCGICGRWLDLKCPGGATSFGLGPLVFYGHGRFFFALFV